MDTVQAQFIASSSSTGSTNITLGTPAGFNTPAGGFTVNATVDPSALIPFTATVGQDLQQAVVLSLTNPATSDVTVTLTSNDPSKLLFYTSTSTTGSGAGSVTFTIPTGHSFPNLILSAQGFASSGTVGYTATATGLGTVNGSVTLASSALRLDSPGGVGAPSFKAPVGFGDATLTIDTGYLDPVTTAFVPEPIAVGQSVTATVVSSNTAVGTISGSPLTISGGFGSGSVTLHPLTEGTTIVTASAPSFASAQVGATFGPQNLILNGGLTLGKSLQGSDSVTLPSNAASGGVQVTITSNSPSLLLAVSPADVGSGTIVVTVPGGSRAAPFFVQSASASGSGTYTASLTGLGSATATAQFVPSGIVVFPPNVSASAATGSIQVSVFPAALDATGAPSIAEPLAGGLSPLTVVVQSSNTSVATVPASVTVSAGLNPNTVNLFSLDNLTISTPHQGSATISITEPAGFSTPTSLTKTSVTVNP